MARLEDLIPDGYRLAKVHNPKDFYPRSLHVETHGKRLVVVGIAKRHIKKGYKIVGILKVNKCKNS